MRLLLFRRKRRPVWRLARIFSLVALAIMAFAVIAPSVAVEPLRGVFPSRATLERVLAPVVVQFARNPRTTISGRARVIDGDTLEIDGTRIRLHGIDAPEQAQNCRAEGRTWPCGQDATRTLGQTIGTRSITCDERDQDPYGRTVAVCRIGDVDLNAWMVAQGFALAYRRYSMDYVTEESAAKTAKRGIWRGEVVPPWNWRRGERLPGAPTAGERRSSRDCMIKGNLGRSGERIYHVPGGRYYEATRINPSSGERWFCSEEDARAAGWRRSRQ